MNNLNQYTKRLLKWATGYTGKAVISLLIVLTLGIVFNADGTFFKLGTHRDALRQLSVYGIMACGMTLVIISGGIDLAVGSLLAVSAVSFSIFSIHMELSPWISIFLCIIIGAGLGSISGFLVSWGKLQPFIATLAMMTFARGFAKYITGGQKISTYIANPNGDVITKKLPEIFKTIDSRFLGGNLTVVSLIFLVCLAITWILLSGHKWGRELFAIGGNEESAKLSGVPVSLSKFYVYVFSGIMCAIAGICQAAQETQGDPEAGGGYELTAIAMVVIGGTSLSGGWGGVRLTFLGILIIGYLEKILSINAVPESGRLMITGLIIVLAVLMQRKAKK